MSKYFGTPQYEVKRGPDGKKLYYPILPNGQTSAASYRRATEAVSATEFAMRKAIELAHAEGMNANQEGEDIQSNPYYGALAHAWDRGWKQAESQAKQDERESDHEPTSLAEAIDQAAEYFDEHPIDVPPYAQDIVKELTAEVLDKAATHD